jgi:hypothetical protein
LNELLVEGILGDWALRYRILTWGIEKLVPAFVHHERGQKDAECGLRLRAAKGGLVRDEILKKLSGPDVKKDFNFTLVSFCIGVSLVRTPIQSYPLLILPLTISNTRPKPSRATLPLFIFHTCS